MPLRITEEVIFNFHQQYLVIGQFFYSFMQTTLKIYLIPFVENKAGAHPLIFIL